MSQSAVCLPLAFPPSPRCSTQVLQARAGPRLPPQSLPQVQGAGPCSPTSCCPRPDPGSARRVQGTGAEARLDRPASQTPKLLFRCSGRFSWAVGTAGVLGAGAGRCLLKGPSAAGWGGGGPRSPEHLAECLPPDRAITGPSRGTPRGSGTLPPEVKEEAGGPQGPESGAHCPSWGHWGQRDQMAGEHVMSCCLREGAPLGWELSSRGPDTHYFTERRWHPYCVLRLAEGQGQTPRSPPALECQVPTAGAARLPLGQPWGGVQEDEIGHIQRP